MEFSEILKNYDNRVSPLSVDEIQEREEAISSLIDISVFEDLIPNEDDLKLYNLYAQGKINKSEYIDLCLKQINHDKND